MTLIPQNIYAANSIESVLTEETDLEKDSDADHLTGDFEIKFGRNPYKIDVYIDVYRNFIIDLFEFAEQVYSSKVDTDWDGLPDGYELLYLGTNPNSKDSDNDGILDRDEDLDEDGLLDGDEVKLGLDPLKAYTYESILDSEYKIKQHLSEEIFNNIKILFLQKR